MNKKEISATLLEKVLILGVVVVFGATVAVYVLLTGFARSQAVDASHSTATASSSQKDIDSLQESHKWIRDHPDEVEKTTKIVADASQYRYQDQAVKDLESFASQVDIRVTKYFFNDASSPAAAAATGSSGSATATTPSAPAALSTGGATSSPSGLVATTIDLGFPEALDYESVLLFIKKIEQNVTRMQITYLQLTPGQNDPSKVKVDRMTISIFLNKGN